MRIRPSLLALLVVCACGGKDPDCADDEREVDGECVADDDTDTTDTDTDTDTDTTTPEDCGDGVDNDGDALVDCEDGDCADEPACMGEQICDDGIDDDEDGNIDCADDDCWGNGCSVSLARLLGTEANTFAAHITGTAQFGGSSCNSTSSITSTGMATLLNPYGSVRFMPASNETWTTCTWSASNTHWNSSMDNWAAGGTGLPVTRDGFQIEEGCPLTSSAFLPQYLRMKVFPNYMVDVTASPDGNGTKWAQLNAASPMATSSTDNSTLDPGSPCNVLNVDYNYFYSVSMAAQGSDYITATAPE